MELVTPGVGLLFWMLLSFTIVLIILRRYAWKPILSALKEREQGIQAALDGADQARKQIETAKSEADKMIEDGRKEREKILKSAREELAEYKQQQQLKINEQMAAQLTVAKEEINQQKRAAVGELKSMVAELSVDIAETILSKELEDDSRYSELINQNIKKLEVN
jgi:F-type H+-transporting ATPase subunit b